MPPAAPDLMLETVAGPRNTLLMEIFICNYIADPVLLQSYPIFVFMRMNVIRSNQGVNLLSH